MGTKISAYIVASMLLVIMFFASSCKHEPVIPIGYNPIPEDTTSTSSSCDSDTVYFVNDVLPIFASSCAMSGCHDAITAENGVILNDYFHILSTGDINPGDSNGSKVYEVLFESGEDLMPPTGSGVTLTADQKDAIYTWILQGARNNACEETLCDTVGVSFSTDVYPILDLHCLGCHSYPALSGGGIPLGSYSDVATYAGNGRLLGSIEHQAGFSAMPLGSAMLSDCKIATIRNWITEGTQDN